MSYMLLIIALIGGVVKCQLTTETFSQREENDKMITKKFLSTEFNVEVNNHTLNYTWLGDSEQKYTQIVFDFSTVSINIFY